MKLILSRYWFKSIILLPPTDQLLMLCGMFNKFDTRYMKQTVKKGVRIKSYLISSAKVTAGFKVWRQMTLYSSHNNGYTGKTASNTLNRKSVNLYLACIKLCAIRALSPGKTVIRCLVTGRRKSVFRIHNVSRLKMFSY